VSPIRILLADDHALLRAGVRSLLEAMPGLEVVAEAVDGESALQLVSTTWPDVALLDIAMPKINGLELAARITRAFPQTRVIILSMHLEEEYVRKAISAGASGYLLKDTGVSELEQAIRAVARGETYLCQAASSQLITNYQKLERGELTRQDPLTPRQREVLRMIAEGMTTKAIARALQISVKTVETHRTQLMDRLDIRDVASLVRYAIRAGIIKDDP